MLLDRLPEELIEAIVSDLNRADFCHFRLVSRAVNYASLHNFAERFFRRQTVSWQASSFSKILDITHSQVFGHWLRDLVIDATPKYAKRLWEINTWLFDNQEPSDRRDLYLIEQKQIMKTDEENAKFWSETRNDQKSLVTVFRKARHLRSITFAYDSMHKNYGTFGRRYCESSQNEMSRPFVSTMEAIVTSGLTIEEITIHDTRKHGAVSLGRLESLARHLSKFDGAFEQLRTLNLNLRDWRHPDEGFEMPSKHLSFAVRFLAKCRNVQDLTLSCFSNLEADTFTQMAENCEFPHLKICNLELFHVNEATLFDFLALSKSTLRSLSLRHIILRDRTSDWARVMRRLADELELESISLEKLFAFSYARIGFGNTINSLLNLDGPQLTENLNHHAAQIIVGNWGPAWHLALVAYPFEGLHA
ncbi:hypothetical protein EJ04DRAFT_565604 [Polyplosphaeria fusca]|uniref:F-box domain-containing protein n=1 Tax=Polyplosphaeria fusca TaxID=682080 RepID=A0A9P4QXT6_9PLEO|nr:hypothetical protein EJ04DRAFT_565604 [Polyplosphaeria fusca]